MSTQDSHALSSKPHFVRQDRVETDPERFTLKLGDQVIAKVLNFSAFGVATESAKELEQSYQSLFFCVDNYPVSEIAMSKVSVYHQSPACVSGFSIEGTPIDVEAAMAIKELNDVLDQTDKSVKQDMNIRPAFKLQVLEIKDVLSKLEQSVNELTVSSFQQTLMAVAHFEDRVATRLSNYLSVVLTARYAELRNALADLSPEQLNEHFQYFRRSLGDIIFKSVYAHRAYTKPKGYAGDFEMMNNVYRRDLRGETLFAKCLQRYFVDEPAGQAVRNREVYFRGKIVDIIRKNEGRPLKFLSVACGPAVEIQNIFANYDLNLDNVEFYLLDQDLDALKFAQRKIQEVARGKNKTAHLKLLNLNIKGVIQNGLNEGPFDFIYSAGLFDYFTDPVAVYAATQLVRATKKGGAVNIGNFSVRNPNQFAMNLIMDWNLVYRTEENMKQLFGSLGTPTVEAEETGINLFAHIAK